MFCCLASAAAAASSFCAAVAAEVSKGRAVTSTTSPRLGSSPAAAVTRRVMSLEFTDAAAAESRSTATDIRSTLPGVLVTDSLRVPRALVCEVSVLEYVPLPPAPVVVVVPSTPPAPPPVPV